MSIAIAADQSESSFPSHNPRVARSSRQVIRRRPTLDQGRALETLGHAVEYLVDSRLYQGEKEESDELAVQTLMRLSREVFAECAELVPLRRRLRWWGTDRLERWRFRWF